MSRLDHWLRRGVFAFSCLAALASVGRADEPGFKAIFNGKDLTGWRVGKADMAGKTVSDEGRFAVKEGVLVISGSNDQPLKILTIGLEA